MLKKTITGASVQVTLDLYTGGSVRAGKITAGATAVRTELTVDSPESKEDIASIIQLAKQGCFAEQMVQNAVPVLSTYVINGESMEIKIPPRSATSD
jgi:hypothetical protein